MSRIVVHLYIYLFLVKREAVLLKRHLFSLYLSTATPTTWTSCRLAVRLVAAAAGAMFGCFCTECATWRRLCRYSSVVHEGIMWNAHVSRSSKERNKKQSEIGTSERKNVIRRFVFRLGVHRIVWWVLS